MPYIPQFRREAIEAGEAPSDPGELTYAVTKNVTKYLGPDPFFESISVAIGVLECAKLELYRRIAAPYENSQHEKNGDVY